MAASEHFLARLLELPRVPDREVRRGIFRQTITALGQGDQAGGPLALAGVDPGALGRSVEQAIADGFLDDIDFIAPAVVSVALYQMAGALPLAVERRTLGRRVLRYLYEGDAETFASLASRMAMSSPRPLRGAGIRARVALSMGLHGRGDAAIDRLALAIALRRDLVRTWIDGHATGSLPDRRLAAQILERAARAAAKRAEAGDPHPLRAFRAIVDPSVRSAARPGDDTVLSSAWNVLLADRETLVWRHVAIARGWLAGGARAFADEVRSMLRDDLSPTEWRRGATSLVARIALDREHAFREAFALLEGPLLRRDPGIAMAMVWGLVPVAEVEPEAAETLAEAIARCSPISIAESLVALRRVVPGFAPGAARTCAEALRQNLQTPEPDDGLHALATAILADLEAGADASPLQRAVDDALDAFAVESTVEAYARAERALGIAGTLVGELERLDVRYGDDEADDEATSARRRAMTLLRQLDRGLHESRELTDLLTLNRPPGRDARAVVDVDDLDARLARWLLDRKRRSTVSDELRRHTTLHQRQLRTLLHLVDGSSTDFGEDTERRMRVRARWSTAIRVFVAHLVDQPSTRLTRAIIATVARTFDALVRDGAAEPVDIFLFCIDHLTDPSHMSVVAEASMQPDVVQLLRHYLQFVRVEAAPAKRQGAREEGDTTHLPAFLAFLEAFPREAAARGEAFRVTALRLARGLKAVAEAEALRDLVPTEGAAETGPLAMVEDAVAQLQQLVIGAERRCSDRVRHRGVLARRHALAHAVETAVNADEPGPLSDQVRAAVRTAEANLPAPVARLVRDALPRLTRLPVERSELAPIPLVQEKRGQLPDWLPSRRIVGGFYILRQLGGGNVGTVFVVKRAEERHDPEAELFALKVPEFNATAARTISETEFLKLFREEAGALLSIPEHPNVAKFVTFDAGARPKPILVMELIAGTSVERLVNARSLTMPAAIEIVDGTMAGLASMHAVGIAHLDVKPSNTIVRERSGVPVLVDFGLAGRRVRPGCATLCYGAPEIWETAPGAIAPGTAAAADVYALGCFAYEVLTGTTLFDGDSDVALISAHITHDGLPTPLDRMASHASLHPLAQFFRSCLRYEPADRAGLGALRAQFRRLRPLLSAQSWPLERPA
ncbi:MAG: protein kinase [Myxococcota bacterium]